MPTKQRFLILLAVPVLSLLTPACSPTTQAVSYFPPAAQAKARCIIQRESGGNPTAISPTQDYGLFQINRAAHKTTFERRYNRRFETYALTVEYNARYARYLYDVAGWSPWNGGRYAC